MTTLRSLAPMLPSTVSTTVSIDDGFDAADDATEDNASDALDMLGAEVSSGHRLPPPFDRDLR